MTSRYASLKNGLEVLSRDHQSRRIFISHNKSVFLFTWLQTQIYFPFSRYDPLQSMFATATKTTTSSFAVNKPTNEHTNENFCSCTRMQHMQLISTANRLHVQQFRRIRLHLLRNLSNDCNAHQSHQPQRWTNYRLTRETTAFLSAGTSDRNTKAKLHYTRLFGCMYIYMSLIEWYALNVYACAEQ